MNIKHFYSDMGTGTPASRTPYNQKPSAQTLREAVTLGAVQVGNAHVMYRDEGKSGQYVVVVVRVPNGIGANIYRDMYKVEDTKREELRTGI